MVLFGTASSKGQVTFNVHLDSVQAGLRGTGFSIRQVETGYLLLGWQYTGEHPAPAHLYTRVLNDDGRVTAQIGHGEGDTRSYRCGGVDPMASLPDGTFIAAVAEGWSIGDSTWLYRFDQTGERIGRHHVMSFPPNDSTYHYFSNLTPLSDGGFVLCGIKGRPSGQLRGLLARLDSTGQIVWSRDYVHAQHLTCVREMSDGGFAVTGYRNAYSDRSVLMRTSSIGDIHWIRYTGGLAPGSGVVRIDEDGAVITWGTAHTSEMPPYSERWVLTKRSSNGAAIWETASETYTSSFTSDLEILPDGGFVAVGGRNSKGLIHRFGSDGQPIWKREYQVLGGSHYFSDVTRASDGGFLLTGGAWRSISLDPEVLTHELTWAMKLDSVGCLVPGCHTVGVQEYASDLNEYLTIAPNPVSAGQPLRFTFDPPTDFAAKGPLHVLLLDAQGKQVHEERMSACLPGQGTTLNLSTSNLSTGLHYLHLTDGSRWLAGGKVVVD